MNQTITIKTGNPIVDEVATLNLTGNIIPESWYHTITNKNGKVYTLAILILADITYWYRPTEIRDETTLSVSYTKKFHDDDYLQRSYEQLMDKFNISKKQARDAIVTLEDLGVIKRHFKNITISGISLSNVMFIELIPDVLRMLTYPSINQNNPDGEDPYKKIDTRLRQSSYPSTLRETTHNENVETYTKTTTENTPNTSAKTSTSHEAEKSSFVVDGQIISLFADLGLSAKDFEAIAKASGNDLQKCQTAIELLNQQRGKIQNVAGWLIKAVKEGYHSVSKSPTRKNGFHDFEEREHPDDYWDQLELALLRK